VQLLHALQLLLLANPKLLPSLPQHALNLTPMAPINGPTPKPNPQITLDLYSPTHPLQNRRPHLFQDIKIQLPALSSKSNHFGFPLQGSPHLKYTHL